MVELSPYSPELDIRVVRDADRSAACRHCYYLRAFLEPRVYQCSGSNSFAMLKGTFDDRRKTCAFVQNFIAPQEPIIFIETPR